MEHTFSFPFWPIKPCFNLNAVMGILGLVGIIFSIIMLIDCLKRKPEEFPNPFTKNAEYDKLIWALGIILTFSYGFAGAIVYFFVVKKAEPKE
jgi:hypothetical protein